MKYLRGAWNMGRLLWALLLDTLRLIRDFDKTLDRFAEMLRRWPGRVLPMVRCPLCGGTGEGKPVPPVCYGEPQPAEYPPCPWCKGRGWTIVESEDRIHEDGSGFDPITGELLVDEYAGCREASLLPCIECGGKGWVVVDDTELEEVEDGPGQAATGKNG